MTALQQNTQIGRGFVWPPPLLPWRVGETRTPPGRGALEAEAAFIGSLDYSFPVKGTSRAAHVYGPTDTQVVTDGEIYCRHITATAAFTIEQRRKQRCDAMPRVWRVCRV